MGEIDTQGEKTTKKPTVSLTVGEGLYKLCKERHEHGGDDAGDGQGQTADRTGQLAHFGGLGGADDVGGGAEGNALSHFTANPEEPAQSGACHIAENAGDDDGGGGDGTDSADFFA